MFQTGLACSDVQGCKMVEYCHRWHGVFESAYFQVCGVPDCNILWVDLMTQELPTPGLCLKLLFITWISCLDACGILPALICWSMECKDLCKRNSKVRV
jgi:hypothetical protein